MTRTQTSYVVGLILVLATQAPAADPIPIIPGEYVTGSIAKGQSNTYSFQANAGDAVSILVVGTDIPFFYPDMELYSPSGRQLVNTQGTHSSRIDAQVLPQTGTYLVTLRDHSASQGEQYGLTVIKNPGPNATDPDGGDMVPGEYKIGTLKAGDLDAFSFQANAGESVTVLVCGGWPQVELHCPSGRRLVTVSAPTSAWINAQVLPQTGTYLLIVSDYFGSAEPYALTVIRNPGPNATDPDGGDMIPGEYKTGTLKAGDVDAFSFQADAEESATVLVCGGWPQLQLHCPDGRELVATSSPDSASINAQVLPQTGTYLLMVSDYFGIEGQYGLTVIKNPGSNVTDPDGGNMAPGEYKTGTIKPGDLDAFAFWANAGDTATIRFRGTQIGWSFGFEPYVELHAPDGAVVATASAAWTDEQADVTAQFLTQTGTYLVIVRDRNGCQEGQYGLILHREPPALVEAAVFQQATIADANVAGDLTGTVESIALEFVRITTGSFAGQGYSRGMFQANLDGTTYPVTWGGVLFARPQEKRVYLKGAISGELLGTVEGYLTESMPESGVFDHYQATWKIRLADAPTMSGTIHVSGIVSYEPPVESPHTPIHVSQNNLSIAADGDYNNVNLGAVVTSLKVIRPDNPGTVDGFSTISFTSKSGSGQAWTYDVQTPSGTTEVVGLLTNPFFGVLSATVQEQDILKSPSVTIHRVDLGAPPAPDLKVEISGPQRISPGQTVNYLVEYRNTGLKAAAHALVFSSLDCSVDYVSASKEAFYDEFAHAACWDVPVIAPNTKGYLNIEVRAVWGLPSGITLTHSVSIADAEPQSEGTIGILVNGVGADANPAEWEKCKRYALSRNLDWVEAFQGGSLQDRTDVFKAFEGEATSTNQLGDPRLEGEVADVHAFSGGTTVVMRKILDGKLTVTSHLRLISPFWFFQYDANIKSPLDLVDALHNRCPGAEIEIWQSPNDRLPLGFWQDNQVKIPEGMGEDRPWLTVVRRTGGHLDLFMDANNEADEDASDSTGSTIIAAHDPNRKFGPQGNVVAGQQLDYRVEYENEGEGIAFAVFFTDTLDPSLDDSTLKIGPVVDVDTGKQIGGVGTYDPETRTIVWLVGQVDPGQGGYADFSVNVRSDATAGTEIINVGTVCFPSVPEETKTNAIISTIVAADSINAQTSASLKQLSLLAMAWLEPDRMDAGW